MARLKSIKAKAQGQINIISKKISSSLLKDESGLVVFNLSNLSEKNIKALIFTKTKQFKLIDDDEEVEILESKQTTIDGRKKIEITAQGDQQVKLPGYYQTDIEFTIKYLPFGYKVLQIEELEKEMISSCKEINSTEIKTKNYQISINNNSLEIKPDLESVNLGLQVQSDEGDSYDFAFKSGEKENEYLNIEDVKVYELNNYYQVKFIINILTPNQENAKVKNAIKVNKHIDDLQFNHTFVNTGTDYRMRAIFKKQIKNPTHVADSGFGAIRRNNIDENIKS